METNVYLRVAVTGNPQEFGRLFERFCATVGAYPLDIITQDHYMYKDVDGLMHAGGLGYISPNDIGNSLIQANKTATDFVQYVNILVETGAAQYKDESGVTGHYTFPTHFGNQSVSLPVSQLVASTTGVTRLRVGNLGVFDDKLYISTHTIPAFFGIIPAFSGFMEDLPDYLKSKLEDGSASDNGYSFMLNSTTMHSNLPPHSVRVMRNTSVHGTLYRIDTIYHHHGVKIVSTKGTHLVTNHTGPNKLLSPFKDSIIPAPLLPFKASSYYKNFLDTPSPSSVTHIPISVHGPYDIYSVLGLLAHWSPNIQMIWANVFVAFNDSTSSLRHIIDTSALPIEHKLSPMRIGTLNPGITQAAVISNMMHSIGGVLNPSAARLISFPHNPLKYYYSCSRCYAVYRGAFSARLCGVVHALESSEVFTLYPHTTSDNSVELRQAIRILNPPLSSATRSFVPIKRWNGFGDMSII